MTGGDGTVIVIGAGIVGASTAFHLADAGARVLVVDDNRHGRATDAGAGIVALPWRNLDSPPGRLRLKSVEAYDEIAGRIGTSVEWVGELLVAPAGRDLDQAEAALTASPAGPARRLSPGTARELFPYLAPDLSALHIERTGRVEGRLVRDRLLEAAVAAGARVLDGPAALVVSDGRVQGAMVGDRRLSARDVVVAAGAWSPALLSDAGLDGALPVAPQRGQIVHLRVAEDTTAMPVVQPLGADHYLVAFADHRVVVGATRETGAGFEAVLTAGGLASVLAQALEVAPGLASATVCEQRVGLRPQTPDGQPLLGPVPHCPGLWVATGMGPEGLTLGPYCGRLVAEALLGRPTDMDLAPFSPSRKLP